MPVAGDGAVSMAAPGGPVQDVVEVAVRHRDDGGAEDGRGCCHHYCRQGAQAERGGVRVCYRHAPGSALSDPVRLFDPPDGLRGIGRHQGGGGHVQCAGEGVQRLHVDRSALLDLPDGSR
jgi:hypothetical protein